MSDDATPAKVRLTDGLGLLADVADAARVLDWARSNPRKPASTAFTAGAERQAAYWIEWAEAAERERCAKVCEEVESQAWALWKTTADPTEQGRSIGAQHCADAIRA